MITYLDWKKRETCEGCGAVDPAPGLPEDRESIAGTRYATKEGWLCAACLRERGLG